MKKLTSLLIGCSLALAGAALAQQPVEQQSPAKGKHAPEKAHATQAQPKPQAPPATHPGTTQQHGATHDAGAMKQQGAAHEHAATNEPGAGKGHNAPAHQESATAPKTNDSADTSTPSARQQRVEQRRKGMKGRGRSAKDTYQSGSPGRGGGSWRRCSVISSGCRPAKCTGERGGQGEEAGSAAGATDQIAARELSCAAEAAASSGGYLQPELSNPRKRSLAGPALSSISLVSSGMARSGMVSLALPTRGADRWRLLFLQRWLLVSGMGLQSFGAILCLRRTDLCGSTC